MIDGHHRRVQEDRLFASTFPTLPLADIPAVDVSPCSCAHAGYGLLRVVSSWTTILVRRSTKPGIHHKEKGTGGSTYLVLAS